VEDQQDANEDREQQDVDSEDSDEAREVHHHALRTYASNIIYDDSDDEVIYIHAGRTTKKEPPKTTGPSRAARWKKTEDRLERSKTSESCLSGFVNINGVDALTLFDSGSNTNSVSPDFARVADL
jgi:hypothetical protein